MENEIKEVLKKIKAIIDEDGYEAYRMATFAFDLGIEEELDQEKMIKLERMYDFYMDNDYFTSPLDEQLIEKYNEEDENED